LLLTETRQAAISAFLYIWRKTHLLKSKKELFMKNTILAIGLALVATSASSEIQSASVATPELGPASTISDSEIVTAKVTDWLDLEQEDQIYVLKQDSTMRIGPNAAFHAVGVMRKGETIESIGRARSWVAFEKDGEVVFIWEGLLNEWKQWPSTQIDATQGDVAKKITSNPQEM
jgi:hypothetical protein